MWWQGRNSAQLSAGGSRHCPRYHNTYSERTNFIVRRGFQCTCMISWMLKCHPGCPTSSLAIIVRPRWCLGSTSTVVWSSAKVRNMCIKLQYTIPLRLSGPRQTPKNDVSTTLWDIFSSGCLWQTTSIRGLKIGAHASRMDLQWSIDVTLKYSHLLDHSSSWPSIYWAYFWKQPLMLHRGYYYWPLF